MLPSLAKRNVRPPLQCELQIDPSRRQINQRPRMIHRQVVMRPSPKLLQLLPIRRIDPPRRMYVHRLEHTLHPILILQPERHHLELQLTDRAQDEIIVAYRLEELRRPFLAELTAPSAAPSSSAGP